MEWIWDCNYGYNDIVLNEHIIEIIISLKKVHKLCEQSKY